MKKKNRQSVPTRLHQRSRSVVATDGVYNNSYFMHATTSHVGNTVQLLTRSGVTFEGIFRTFSPQFEVVLEMAHRVEVVEKEESNFNASTVVDILIFKPTDIVSILAKDVDLDYATRDYFQTDSAISSRCNGSSREDKELEPWDPSSGTLNGEQEFLLELDGNANGWDANDMFHKNETMYGVQSTFDQSLAGYTIQIQKKDTQDFKDAEAKAEEIAKEIESQPLHNERLDVENGDEEDAFAAVSRPKSSNPDAKGEATNTQKYVPPAKRKGQSTGKLVRSTPPPSNNNGPQQIPQSPQAPKNNNYQAISMVQPPPPQQQPPPQSQQPQINATPQQYIHTQPPYMHSQPPPPLVVGGGGSKMNGDGANAPSGTQQQQKAQMPPRNMRQQYTPQATAPPPPPQVAYTEPPPSMVMAAGQMGAMGKPPMHVAHPHAHVVATHMAPPPPPGEAISPPGMVHQIITVPQKMVSAPPQPQRTPRSREEQVQEFRNFKDNFQLAPPSNTHQHPPPDHSPPQIQVPQQPPPPPQAVVVLEGGAVMKSQHQSPSPPQEMQQQMPPPQMMNPAVPQQPPPQQVTPQPQVQQPPLAVTPSSGAPSASTTPPQQSGAPPPASTPSSGSDGSPAVAEKPAGTKKYVLNPAAKPFTPRSPSTPNPSRPHTPQTPGPPIVQAAATAPTGGYPQPAQHVAAAPTSLMTIPATYVMQPTQQAPFQTSQHHHAGQPSRYRKAASEVGYSSSAPRWDRRNLSYPVQVQASQIQVQAATGTPILAAAPIQQFMPYAQTPHHPQQFHSQPYQHMIRMYSDAPHQPPLQYLAPTPPSTTPSPGQPHQQYHPQPSPAGGGPPTFTPAGPQTPQFQMMCPVIAPPQLMPQYFQGTGQPPHGNIHMLMQQQHPAQ
ncbi:hypothetical protein DMENIID0001_080650 [Sergentomyia squamirostris]